MVRTLLLSTLLSIAALPGCKSVEAPPPAAAQFDSAGRMLFPADYRDWVYLSTGVNMSYSERPRDPDTPVFDSVFVNRPAYESFRRTGHWPDGTVLALEVRGGKRHGSINKSGAFQSGDRIALEVHTRDSRRFKGGWAFFGFEGDKPAEMIPTSAQCYACHQADAAVDTTFVQFYPTMLPIAQRLKTLSPAFVAADAKEKAAETGAAAKVGKAG